MHLYHVYILTNDAGRVLYTGVTGNLLQRLYQHKNKLAEGFSAKYNLNKLIYVEHTENIEAAILREKQIKGWIRQKKIDLINQQNPEWIDLSLTLTL